MQTVILALLGPRTAVVVLALLVSACIAKDPTAERGSDLGPADTPERMPSAPDRVQSNPKEDRTMFPFQFAMNDCVNARLFTVLEKADAQALLPPGYRAANASDFTRVVHHVALSSLNVTGKTMVAYDFVRCVDHDPGRNLFSGWSVVAIQIEPPRIGSVTPLDDRDLNFYFSAAHAEDGKLLRAFRDAGYGANAQLVAINSTVDLATPTLAMNGRGVVRNQSGLVAEFSYVEVGAPRTWDSSGRFWHSNGADTSYLEWRSQDEDYGGRVLSCTNAADSAHRAVSGIDACDNETMAFALTGVKSYTEFTLKAFPGILPEGPA